MFSHFLFPVGKHFLPAVFRRYVRRGSEEKSPQKARNDKKTDARMCVGLSKTYVREGENGP